MKSTVSRSRSSSSSRGDGREPGFGVTVGGRGKAGDGAEVALAVDEPVAQDPVLGHADERVVDRRVAVRVVPLHRLADDAGALAGRGGRPEAEVVHGDEDAPLGRLEPVADIWQGPADDDRLGVREVTVSKFVYDIEVVDRLPARSGRFLRRGRGG